MAAETHRSVALTPRDEQLERVPQHVAIIMDGNGRWAVRHGLPRIEGHRRGVEAVRRAVRSAAEVGVRYLTIYSFSAENWRRPAQEEGLAADITGLLNEAEELTRANTGLNLVVAFNYGGRQEIVRAVRAIARQVKDGRLDPDDIAMETIAGALDTQGIPDPDLVIRTSGEQRVSNFLPWQTAYSEFVFLPDFWPDFDDAAFKGAIGQYVSRDRRFGGLSAKAS
jgi:undecaprenyl diphosphate synthase